MTEQQTVDLVAWLTAIWDEEERLATEEVELVADVFRDADYTHEYQWQRLTYRPSWSGRSSNSAPGAPSPSQVLARIAADRKILELHGVAWNGEVCTVCHHLVGRDLEVDNDAWPCETVRLLASPYKGREGWQEEWDA